MRPSPPPRVMAEPNPSRSTVAKDYPRLWKDITHASDEGRAVRILATILVDKEGRTFISSLSSEDAKLCVEILDHGIAEHNLKTAEKQAFFVVLRRLAGIHERLPDSMMITKNIMISDKILASSGFADVRTGMYMGHLVAVKTMRVAEWDDYLRLRKRFCKEAVLWNTLSHPNVLKLAGVLGGMDQGRFATVSEWMMHGNIMQYTRKDHVNRLELLHGASQGLKYLHGANLVHGDLKVTNILVSNDNPPRACLADFGFMTRALDPNQPMLCGERLERSATVFMSPELLVSSKFGFKDSMPTLEADIYAFGFVIYQVLTGEIPFRGIRTAELVFNVVQGVRPAKPENASAIGFSDSLWDFVQRCWDGKIELRPKAAEVVTELEIATADWDKLVPPSIQTGGVASVSKESTSGSIEHCGICQLYSDSFSSLNTLSTSELSSCPDTPSTQFTELPPEELPDIFIRLFNRLPFRPSTPPYGRSFVHRYPRRRYPPQSSPPLPRKTRRGFRYLIWRFRRHLCL